MNQKDFETVYRQFCLLADFGGNLYMSEAVDAALDEAEAEPVNTEKRREALLQVQLSSALFQDMVERHRSLFLSGDENAIYDACIADILERRLKNLTSAQRGAALAEMIGKLFEIAGEPLSEEETALLAGMSEKELERRLHEMAVFAARDLIARCGAEAGLTEETAVEAELTPSAFTADAGACAAYVCDGSMRAFPEMAGVTSAAVAACAELSALDETLDVAEVVSAMMTLTAVIFIVSVLIAVALGTGSIALDAVLYKEAAVSLPMLAETFSEVLGRFVLEMKIAFGVGITNMLTFAAIQCHNLQTGQKLAGFFRLHLARSADADTDGADEAVCLEAADDEEEEREDADNESEDEDEYL